MQSGRWHGGTAAGGQQNFSLNERKFKERRIMGRERKGYHYSPLSVELLIRILRHTQTSHYDRCAFFASLLHLCPFSIFGHIAVYKFNLCYLTYLLNTGDRWDHRSRAEIFCLYGWYKFIFFNFRAWPHAPRKEGKYHPPKPKPSRIEKRNDCKSLRYKYLHTFCEIRQG
jgi:hypothetical protein